MALGWSQLQAKNVFVLQITLLHRGQILGCYLGKDVTKDELKLIDEALISDKSTQLPRFKEVKYSQISEFPLIKRDLSFQVDDINEINELCCLIDSFRHELLRDSFIFDFYQDEKRNRCKVGFRFSFQSMKKTLIDAEVDEIIDDIVKSLSSLKNTEIPGYDYQDS